MIYEMLSKRERYIFVAAMAVIVLALTYNFVLEPFLKRWDYLNNEIIVKETEFRKAIKLLKARDSIVDEYSSYSSPIKKMSKILAYIEAQASSSGIKTDNVRPMPLVQKELYKEYVIELQVEGDFANINRFISNLINPPISISIKRFDLRKTSEGSSYLKGILTLSHLLI